MKKWLLAAVVLSLNSFGCGASQKPASSPTVDTRAVATAFVHTAVDVWMAAYSVCQDASQAADSVTLMAKCADVLVPSHDSIVAAADAVDGWTAVDQANWPCLAAAVVDGITQIKTLVAEESKPDAGTPNVITSVLNLAPLFPACVPVDGGK